jgi:signal transduction histidine kinase
MIDVLVLLDSDSRVKYCSNTVSRVLGLCPEEVLGQPLLEIIQNKLSDSIPAESLDSLLELISNPTDVASTLELTYLEPKRKEFIVTVFPIPSGLDDIRTGLSVRDVSEEREIEGRRDNFVAVISHELRDPITAMMGFSKLLLEKGSFNSVEREWLENIRTCEQRLTTITSDMLDVVAIRTGNLTVNTGPVQLPPIVDEALLLIKGAHSRHEFSVSMSRDLPPVNADRTRLAQVIGNLLSNAVKYSPEGGQVGITTRHDTGQRRVIVAISDQGLGVPPEDMEHIFAPFQRAHRPRSQAVGGVGLGLYIVKGLVELMQGTLWMESEVGRGSTFYVSLPTSPVVAARC